MKSAPHPPIFYTKDTRKVTDGNFSKSKIQNPNFKTNPKSQIPKTNNLTHRLFIGILDFGFVLRFEV
jgi:hypothetical protein